MERKDLLSANGPIFVTQGRAINANAAPDARIVVVGNPANTNCLIAMNNAPDVPPGRFSAMTRLDYNRARTMLAHKAGCPLTAVTNVTIWGNHSATQYPDAFHAQIDAQPAAQVIGDDNWIKETFVPTVQQRGAAVIAARGASSAASAANACINHVQTWYAGTSAGDWASMGIPSTGDYGTPAGVIFSYPLTIRDGDYSVVDGLDLSEFDRSAIAATAQELIEERDAVADWLV